MVRLLGCWLCCISERPNAAAAAARSATIKALRKLPISVADCKWGLRMRIYTFVVRLSRRADSTAVREQAFAIKVRACR
jgi:hypothetical protein